MEDWQLLSAFVAGLCLALIGVALTRMPRTPVALPVQLFVASGVLWAVGDVVAVSATNMAMKQVGVSLLYTGSISMPALWWLVVLRWAEVERAGLPLRQLAWKAAPAILAGSMWLVMITNPWHGAFMTPVVGGRNLYQPLWYVMAVPSYALIVAALGVEVAVAWRVGRREVRRQAAFLISASLVTLLGNAVYVAGLVQIDLAPMVLSVSGALLVVGMAREGLFGVVPWALPGIAADHPDGLVVVGPDDQVRYANTRALELLSPIELRSSVPLTSTLRDSRLRAESSNCLAGGAGEPYTTLGQSGGMLFRLDGEQPRWLHLSSSSVAGLGGRTKGHCVRISDRTAQEEAELHARQTRRLDSVADLARTLARQFRGAFALVHDNAELLLAEPSSSWASEPGSRIASDRKLSRIIEAAKYGSETAQQLQLYTGSVSTARVLVELSEVVDESCALVESDLPGDVRLVFHGSDDLLPVQVDAIQLRHAIFNVLRNAIESMEQKPGEIRVSTGDSRIDPAARSLVWGGDQPAGDFAYVSVRDEGGGMDPETEERAFEPFFSTRGKDRGSGLPTVLGIARAHDALVALENERGRGCELTIYFPLEREAGPA